MVFGVWYGWSHLEGDFFLSNFCRHGQVELSMQNTKEVGPHIRLKNSRDHHGDGRHEIASNLEQWVVYRELIENWIP